ncbi:splicing factor U2af large subunit B-like [Aristolochia californica]|uniref:splicing factor U2af large subunit B-like n=1 Tax=Aristolochia californica TaxID=171875 RepID=UPI0035DF459D
MSGTGSLKDNNDRKNVLLQGNANEGTSARTRPFSFEEIMVRRQNKKLAVDAKDAEPMNLSDSYTTLNVFSHPDSDGGTTSMKESVPIKPVKEDTLKGTSRTKEEVRSRKEDDLVKDKTSCDLATNLKLKSYQNSSSRDRGAKIEKQSHSRNRTDECLRNDLENKFEKRKPKDVASKDRYNERENNSKRLGKRKHQNENGDRSKAELDVSSLKKHDLKRHQQAEYSERKARKKESSGSFYEEVKSKRRRSRSHEHVQDRDEKSLSISPRAQKREPYHSIRSGRHQFDADKNKTASNDRPFSGSYRRNSGHSSRLGGYSPRKRRSEAAVKTPSPTNRSPERTSVAWDFPPSGTINNSTGSSKAGFQQSEQAVSLNSHGLSICSSVTLHSQSGLPSLNKFSVNKIVSIDSIQLTHATRPMRRLYVENVPLLASDKSLMEGLNDFLLSSGVNHVEGTKPCISCIINKEKGQAVVEFLTPEDATSALAFDGKSVFNSILKVRRPKDFVEAAAGDPEGSVVAAPTVLDIVKDSPHKIFIGGISKCISSVMLKEIASAFGVLKACHFELNKGLNEHFAFLEYADQSITPKACAGLNGMKLGGAVLTVAQANPDASRQEITERPPFYGIPEYVKPLLQKPTQVLKLKNVFTREEFFLLTEPELEEMLEDIRLECARFGTVKSVNLIKYSCSDLVVHHEVDIVNDTSAQSPGPGNGSEAEPNLDHSNCVDQECGKESFQSVKEAQSVEEDFHLSELKPKQDYEQDESIAGNLQDTDAEAGIGDSNQKLEQTDTDLQKLAVQLNDTMTEKADVITEHKCGYMSIFEEGCILVEYMRKEAACTAAHSLHGRFYGDRMVSAGYAPYDLYQARFARLLHRDGVKPNLYSNAFTVEV